MGADRVREGGADLEGGGDGYGLLLGVGVGHGGHPGDCVDSWGLPGAGGRAASAVVRAVRVSSFPGGLGGRRAGGGADSTSQLVFLGGR